MKCLIYLADYIQHVNFFVIVALHMYLFISFCLLNESILYDKINKRLNNSVLKQNKVDGFISRPEILL